MKTIIKILLIALPFTLSINDVQAQDNDKKIKTIEFKVEGVCKMCKERIENAALIRGVKMAEWDKDSGIIKVIFKPGKTSEDEIHQAIAEAGHDTEKIKAADDAYDDIPDCCAYRDGVPKH